MHWLTGGLGSGRRRHRRRADAEHEDVEESTDAIFDSDVVADCEAFLLGRYAESLEARSEPVPVWAWTNVLAHGCREDVCRASAGGRVGWSSTRRWRVARTAAAGELLDRVGSGASLADMQREVLVPLELELVSCPGDWACTPERWLEAVRSALHSYRPSSRT